MAKSWRSSSGSPKILAEHEIDPQQLQLLKSLGYGQKTQRTQQATRAAAPLIVFQGPPLTEAPVSLRREGEHPALTHTKAGRSQRTKPLPPLCNDPYVDSSNVAGLKKDMFKKFIKHWDATMVLFYNPFDSDCNWARINIKKAACSTRREGHAYAAVDCTKECELCIKQGIKTFPVLKLYSRGKLVNTFSDAALTGRDIQSYVENSPEVEEASPKKCSIQ